MNRGKSVPSPKRSWTAWLLHPPRVPRYAAAVLLAAAAQLARLPFDRTFIPHVTYIPFVVLAAGFGGFGPGLLATGLCFLESKLFATAPAWSFAVEDPRRWEGLGALLFTGLVVSLLFGREKKARRRDAIARELAALLKQTYDAVFVWELESKRITFWDRGAQRLYGYADHEALGRSPQELLATRFAESLAACLAEIRQSGRWEGELVHTTRDGRQVTVESRMSLRRGDDGQLRVIEVSRDIGERQRLMQAQAQLAREQETAAADTGIHHSEFARLHRPVARPRFRLRNRQPGIPGAAPRRADIGQDGSRGLARSGHPDVAPSERGQGRANRLPRHRGPYSTPQISGRSRGGALFRFLLCAAPRSGQ